MDSRAKELIGRGDYLFTKKQPLLTLWQEFNEHFYPERADYTSSRSLGEEFASNLMTSYPVLCRRELGAQIQGLLRPTEKDWAKMETFRMDRVDNAGRAWLQEKTQVQKRAMYDPVTGFVRATKEGDNDFVTIGQCVITTELNNRRDAMLYRCRHPRDVAWCENSEGKIDEVHDKHRLTARDLTRMFRGKPGVTLHEKVVEAMSKNAYQEFQVRRVIIPSDDYDTGSGPNGKSWKTPFVSVYVDIENGHVIEEVGVWTKVYTIPRWQTVSGSQYAYSPCTVAGIADARLIQQMTLILLEAGEKAVNPPMLAKEDVIKSGIDIFAGGTTWMDSDYDERNGEAMRPIASDHSGIPLGMELREDVKRQLLQAFYLNKLNLPSPQPGMTAYEVGQRVQEYIRSALPLFEPMETDYNGSLCMDTFETLLRSGVFGSVHDMPQSLRGQDIQFKFESPLHDAVDRQKGHTFMEAKAMLAEAVALDRGAANIVDVQATIRDVLDGIGTPAKWLRSEDQMREIDRKMAEKQSQEQLLASMTQGAVAAEQIGKAGEALKSVQTPIPT